MPKLRFRDRGLFGKYIEQEDGTRSYFDEDIGGKHLRHSDGSQSYFGEDIGGKYLKHPDGSKSYFREDIGGKYIHNPDGSKSYFREDLGGQYIEHDDSSNSWRRYVKTQPGGKSSSAEGDSISYGILAAIMAIPGMPLIIPGLIFCAVAYINIAMLSGEASRIHHRPSVCLMAGSLFIIVFGIGLFIKGVIKDNLRHPILSHLAGFIVGFGIITSATNSLYPYLFSMPSKSSIRAGKIDPIPSTSGLSHIRLKIGAEAIWKPTSSSSDEDVWKHILENCGGIGNYDMGCITIAMRQKGASSEAIEFTEQMQQGPNKSQDPVLLTEFREMGNVDLAAVSSPVRNSPDTTRHILVNGQPKVVELWDKIRDTDITKDSLYPSLISRFPKLELWPKHEFIGMERLPQGGQRFVFSFVLLNGCRGCEIAGSAEVAYDFDQSGDFKGTRLLRLVDTRKFETSGR